MKEMYIIKMKTNSKPYYYRNPNPMMCRNGGGAKTKWRSTNLPLNENVLREVHPLPKLNHLITVVRSQSFYRKSEFWQIPLDPESFLTTFGRFVLTSFPLGSQAHQNIFKSV